ncbi:hypothetical protein Lalb_Chr17g0345191 [Lupinus albus]|uniref:Uncharacterized protein n=1 Tax=Lupinus albus TaxID=3870 RepID=A0A6A4P3H4_LUPAL|nr:hypothetical protein Lalb_Chr17g0345191 [Lupinus albus]
MIMGGIHLLMCFNIDINKDISFLFNNIISFWEKMCRDSAREFFLYNNSI